MPATTPPGRARGSRGSKGMHSSPSLVAMFNSRALPLRTLKASRCLILRLVCTLKSEPAERSFRPYSLDPPASMRGGARRKPGANWVKIASIDGSHNRRCKHLLSVEIARGHRTKGRIIFGFDHSGGDFRLIDFDH